jgi:hypothetical protein
MARTSAIQAWPVMEVATLDTHARWHSGEVQTGQVAADLRAPFPRRCVPSSVWEQNSL